MNTAAHSGHYPTAHGDWLAVQISLWRPQQLEMWLKIVQHDDTGQVLTPFMCVLIHHPHLAHHPHDVDNTAEPPVVPSASKPPPPPKPSLNETVPHKRALWCHWHATSKRAGNGSNAPTFMLKWPTSRRLRLYQWGCDIQPDQDLEPNSFLTWISCEIFSVAFELSMNFI